MIGSLLCSMLGLLVVFVVSYGALVVGEYLLFLAFVLIGWGAYLGFQESTVLGVAMTVGSFGLVVPTIALGLRLRGQPKEPPPSKEDTSLRDEALHALVGCRGRTLTPLRPGGVAEFEGRRRDVLAECSFLEPQTTVQGVGVRGTYVIVRPVLENHSPT